MINFGRSRFQEKELKPRSLKVRASAQTGRHVYGTAKKKFKILCITLVRLTFLHPSDSQKRYFKATFFLSENLFQKL